MVGFLIFISAKNLRWIRDGFYHEYDLP